MFLLDFVNIKFERERWGNNHIVIFGCKFTKIFVMNIDHFN